MFGAIGLHGTSSELGIKSSYAHRDSLVFACPFKAFAGTVPKNLVDDSVLGLHGGAIVGADGLSLQGQSQYATIPQKPWMNFGDKYTIVAFVKRPDISADGVIVFTLFSVYTGENKNSYMLRTENNLIYHYVFDSSGALLLSSTSAALAINTVHRFAMSNDGSTFRVSFDGAVIFSQPLVQDINPVGVMYLGCYSPTTGSLRQSYTLDFLVFNKYLSLSNLPSLHDVTIYRGL